jgi:hypothetical protein
LSFRDGPKDQTGNFEIPRSLVSLALRNDGSSVTRARCRSPYPCPAAALALYDLVAFFQQALALAILALLLLLDFGAFLARHDILQTIMRRDRATLS